MTAPFAALEDRLSDAVDAMFGEDWTHLPMAQPTPNSRRQPDATRGPAQFRATIDDRNHGSASFARLGATSGGVASHGGAPNFSASNPMLFVDERQFPAGIPVRLDRVRRTATGDVYEIADLHKDGQGRWKMALVKVAKD